MSAGAPLPAPGWYADPESAGTLRYWDGARWTDSRALATQGAGHPGHPGYSPPPRPSTSGKAIASLVLGIVWVYGITSVLAIVFAVLARRDIRESNGWVTGGGMATAGLVLGIVGVVGVIVVLILALALDPDLDTTTDFGPDRNSDPGLRYR